MLAPEETERPGSRLRGGLQAEITRGNVYAPDCPSRALLEHVTSRWGVLVLGLLLDGPHRFNELGALIAGVSDKMLSQTLKVLVADGFVERLVDDGPPVRVSYRLSEAGHEVASRIAELVEWLEDNVAAIEAARPAPPTPPIKGVGHLR